MIFTHPTAQIKKFYLAFYRRHFCHKTVHYKPDSHAFLDVGRSNLVAEINHELGELFDIDDVLGIICVRVDDLCTASYLERLFT